MSVENSSATTDSTLGRLSAGEWMDVVGEFFDRIVLGALLHVFLLMHIFAFNEVFSEAEATELQNAYDLGFTTLGVFEATQYGIFLWMFIPILNAIFREIRHRVKERGSQ